MFIQFIEGKVEDAAALRRQAERWQAELAPGATGFLGSTGGVAADGTGVVVARFESEDAARRNSERPEQGAWWNETAKCFDGEPTFVDCAEVDVYREGGSDGAGFVQVILGRAKDKARLQHLDDAFNKELAELRPDVLGGVRGWNGDRFVEVVYFTSEAEAREGERKMGEGEMAGQFQEWMGLVEEVRYVDLGDPWLFRP